MGVAFVIDSYYIRSIVMSYEFSSPDLLGWGEMCAVRDIRGRPLSAHPGVIGPCFRYIHVGFGMVQLFRLHLRNPICRLHCWLLFVRLVERVVHRPLGSNFRRYRGRVRNLVAGGLRRR